MTDIAAILSDTIACANGGDWPRYRVRFAALREAIERTGIAEEGALRRHLEILGAASPEHDAAGCVAELQALAQALGASTLERSADAGAAPALDLRGLRPPEPIMRIFDALQRSPDRPLRVILPHEPAPLYQLLRERGFRYSGSARADGGFELLIEKA